jgi:hypothetical protein
MRLERGRKNKQMNVRSSIFRRISIWEDLTKHFVWPNDGTENGVYYRVHYLEDSIFNRSLLKEADKAIQGLLFKS